MRASRGCRDCATRVSDEAGPYQAIPQPGGSWQPEGRPVLHPHEYVRGGTAKLLTLFRPGTGQLRAKGVLSAPNVVLHPWLQEQLSEVLAEIEKKQPAKALPAEAERPLCARWETWLGHAPRTPLPPLRVVLVWDNLAGHLSPDLVLWLFEHGVMPLYTPLSGSWPEYWPSRCNASLCRAPWLGSIPKLPRKSLTGWSKPWSAGISTQRLLSGMASAVGGVNALV
jgi:hypothetical protein